MLEKGVSVGITSPALKDLTRTVVQDVTVPTLETIVRTHEAQIRDLPYENCFAFADDGTIVLQKSGTVNQIEISDAEGRLLKGTVFTHNHPGGTSFSSADIHTACMLELREVRATGKYRTYIMRMADGTNFTPSLWNTKIRQVYESNNRAVEIDFWTKIGRGELSRNEAALRHAHEVWSRTANEISDITYSYIEEI